MDDDIAGMINSALASETGTNWKQKYDSFDNRYREGFNVSLCDGVYVYANFVPASDEVKTYELFDNEEEAEEACNRVEYRINSMTDGTRIDFEVSGSGKWSAYNVPSSFKVILRDNGGE